MTSDVRLASQQEDERMRNKANEIDDEARKRAKQNLLRVVLEIKSMMRLATLHRNMSMSPFQIRTLSPLK